MLRTWHVELAVVAFVLACTVVVTHAPAVEWFAAFGVLAAFAHGQVADRLAEKEAARPIPDVECHRWARRYFVAKEAFWFAYFVTRGAWAALAGCAVFLAYPAWRAWWRFAEHHEPCERCSPPHDGNPRIRPHSIPGWWQVWSGGLCIALLSAEDVAPILETRSEKR